MKKKKEDSSKSLYQLQRQLRQRLGPLYYKVHILRPYFVLGTGCPAESE